MCGYAERAQHEGVPDQHAADSARQGTIGEPRSDQIAEDHAYTKYREHKRHVAGRQAGNLGQSRCDVAVYTEQTTETHRPDTERQPDLLATERAQFTDGARALDGANTRHPAGNESDR